MSNDAGVKMCLALHHYDLQQPYTSFHVTHV